MVHTGNMVMHGIHNMFLSNANKDQDLMSLKKERKLEATKALKKKKLGFEFNGLKKNCG